MSRYLVERTATQLRQRAAAVAADGGKFPTESALIEELEVSRTTVREAISRLEAEGVLLRRHGTDTVVNAIALQLRDQHEREQGARWNSVDSAAEVLENTPLLIEDDVAALLDVVASHPARMIKRLWRHDGTPIAYEIEHVVLPTWPMELPDPDADLFALAHEVYEETVIWRVDSTDARAANEIDAELLAAEVGAPVLVTDEIFVTSRDRRLAHIRLVQKPEVGAIVNVTTFPDQAVKK